MNPNARPPAMVFKPLAIPAKQAPQAGPNNLQFPLKGRLGGNVGPQAIPAANKPQQWANPANVMKNFAAGVNQGAAPANQPRPGELVNSLPTGAKLLNSQSSTGQSGYWKYGNGYIYGTVGKPVPNNYTLPAMAAAVPPVPDPIQPQANPPGAQAQNQPIPPAPLAMPKLTQLGGNLGHSQDAQMLKDALNPNAASSTPEPISKFSPQRRKKSTSTTPTTDQQLQSYLDQINTLITHLATQQQELDKLISQQDKSQQSNSSNRGSSSRGYRPRMPRSGRSGTPSNPYAHLTKAELQAKVLSVLGIKTTKGMTKYDLEQDLLAHDKQTGQTTAAPSSQESPTVQAAIAAASQIARLDPALVRASYIAGNYGPSIPGVAGL